MIRSQSNDGRVWTSGGLNSAFYGFHWSRYQNGGDRSPNSGTKEEHSYVGNHSYIMAGCFKWYHKDTVNRAWDYGYSTYSPSSTDPVWTANDELALIGQLREKLMQTGLNGGNFLGELPQTAGLLGGKLGLLANALAVVAGVNKKKPVRYNKGKRRPPKKKPPKGDSLIANSWLEFSFGVLPLIDDVYELAKIASEQNVARTRVKARRKGKDGVYSSPWSYAECTGKRTIKKQIVCILEQEELPTFWEQFGLADPATIPWELMPWSFVVDWVLPIGKFIEAQSFVRRMKGQFVYTTYSTGSWSMNVTGPFGNYNTENVLGEFGRYYHVNRAVQYTLNVPFPSLKSSLLGGKPLDRIANALSLMAQVFARK